MAVSALWTMTVLPQPSYGMMSSARRSEVFYQAQRAYEQGVQLATTDPAQAERLLREAADGFQGLVDDGVVNGRLLYNLGNTHLRLNQVGRAILNYRRAEQLIPADDRLVEGLRVARSIRRTDIPVAGRSALIHALLFWHYQTTFHGRALVGLVFYVLFWLAAVGATLRRHFAWRYVLAILLVVWVSLGISAGVSAYGASHWREGVVLAGDVTVAKDPGVGSSPEFKEKLQQGVEFELLEQQARWYHIRLPNGKTGWIPQETAELI
jgi:hypothetical protein